MKIASAPRLTVVLVTLALWALVAGCALYWVWRVRTPPSADAPLAGNSGDLEHTADPQAVARALGATGGRPASGGDAMGRFVLRGVVTHGADSGAALIAVDGKPPKPVRVGAPVGDADGWTLRSIAPHNAVLASSSRQVTLDVPQPDLRLDTHADTRPEGRPDMRSGSDVRAPARPPLLAGQRGPGFIAPHPTQQP